MDGGWASTLDAPRCCLHNFPAERGGEGLGSPAGPEELTVR